MLFLPKDTIFITDCNLCLHDSVSLVYIYGCLDSSYWGYIANEGIYLIPV